MVLGSSLSAIISNIFMEHFEQSALDSVPNKPAMWLKYVDNTLLYCHMVQRNYKYFFCILTASGLPHNLPWKWNQELCFLSMMSYIYRKGIALLTKVYRKPTNTGLYLHFNCNHLTYNKTGEVHGLINTTRIFQKLALNGHLQY
jgi:hypothetical protein